MRPRPGARLTAYATPGGGGADPIPMMTSGTATSSTSARLPPPRSLPSLEDDEGNKLKWMEILEESAEYDLEIQSLLDGAESNPDTVEQRIRERFEKKKERIHQEREGAPSLCW